MYEYPFVGRIHISRTHIYSGPIGQTDLFMDDKNSNSNSNFILSSWIGQLEHPSEGFIHIPIAWEVINLALILVCWEYGTAHKQLASKSRTRETTDRKAQIPRHEILTWKP